jgi:hypothetical protein
MEIFMYAESIVFTQNIVPVHLLSVLKTKPPKENLSAVWRSALASLATVADP